MNTLFNSIFSSAADVNVSVTEFAACLVTALVIGAALALAHSYKCHVSNSFAATLAMLPAVVSVVIMSVNGNLGAGIAVAGAFSLVRFRSVPGTAKEIGSIFLAMAAGLLVGMGMLSFAVIFTVVMGAMILLYARLGAGNSRAERTRILRVTIPEDLNKVGLFDDIFREYASTWSEQSIRTTNMGSMYKMSYLLELKDTGREKEMIDAIRCRNGNLEISLNRQEVRHGEEL